MVYPTHLYIMEVGGVFVAELEENIIEKNGMDGGQTYLHSYAL